MQLTGRRRAPETLFIMALFCVFVISSIALSALGAGVYRATAGQMDITFDRGAATAYLRTKLRQSDVSGSISTGRLDDVPAVVIESKYDGNPYYTYLYFYDGALMELFTMPGSGAGPGSGEEIARLDGFEIEQISGSLLKLTASDRQGGVSEIYVHLRSGGD